MTSKEFRLDFEALLSQMLNGKGYLHYGYWESGKADEVSLCRLGMAQQAYFDQLAGAIPARTASILDVGSGTGSNAHGLLQKGYSVDCVCPSQRLNLIARQKLPQTSQIFECQFEVLKTDKAYDLLVFSESFHYLDAPKAFRQMVTYARKNVLVFDYFPRVTDTQGNRITHAGFNRLISESFADKFRVVSDRDVTPFIMPTFQVLDEFKNHYARPFVAKTIAAFRADHPFYAFLLSIPLRKLLAKVEKTSNRARTFLESYEYRLILLERT